MKSIQNRWNRFFFEPQNPATLAVYRIAICLVAFLSILGKFPVRQNFYGREAMISYDTMSKHIPEPAWAYFRWMPLDEPGLALYFLFTLFCIVCLMIGYQSRVFSILTCALMISFSNRNMYIDNNGDNLLRISFFFLMFADCGAKYSVDAWLRARRGLSEKLISPWPQRLLQLQLCYLYFETAWTKNGPGWNDGTALYYALNYLELRRFDFTFLFSNLFVVKVATWSVLVIEYAGATLIWIRKLRYFIVLGLFGLHLGINLSMQFPVFQYAMMASLLNFIEPKHMESAVSILISKFRRKTA